MEPRDSFVFYRSFYEAVTLLRPKERTAVILAICEYALDGIEPELDGIPRAIFLMAKPNLDANQRRYEAGTKGGRPRKQAENHRFSEKEPNEDVNENADANADEHADVDADGAGKGEGSGPLRGEPPQAETAPSFRQVEAAARERGCPQLARDFFDYYSAAGWRDMDGKPVRSWRQKLVAWQLREDQKRPRPQSPPGQSWAELARETEAVR